jgi:hypothetical protein
VAPLPHRRAARAAASCLAPEARVLLLSVAGADADDELRTLLRGDINWPVLLQLALQERAAPVLSRRLDSLDVHDGVDETFRVNLRRHALIAGFGQQHLEQRLADALRELDAAGCRVMLLKGAALGITAYPAFRDRPMRDIDLLLPETQTARAYALLLASGWERAAPPEQDRFYDAHHHLAPLRDPQCADTVLEVHRQLFPSPSPFRLSADDVRAAARPVEWRGARLHVPSVEHALLHLCIHYAWSHMAYRGTLRAFSDLHALTTRCDIDWSAFCRSARDARAATCAYWTLRLAAGQGGVAVPAHVIAELRPPGPGRWLDRLERHLVVNLVPSDRACPSVRAFRGMWTAAMRPGWSGHGAIRPWDEAPREPAPPPAGGQRVRTQVRRFGAWRRYVAALLNA